MVAAVPASAEEEARTPRLEVEIDIEVENDWTFKSDDRGAQLNDLYTKVEPALALRLMPGLSLQSGLVLETVRDPDPAENRFFEDQGLLVEQLYLLYEQDMFSAHAGKFNLPFGVGWDVTPGVYGTDVAEAFYEQAERIGFGGALNFGGDGIGGEVIPGEHRLSFQTFFADTSVLSEALITGRDRVRLADGGVSNTESFSSYAFSLDGGSLVDGPHELKYHLGVLYQDGGVGADDDEVGIAVALYGSYQLMEGTNFEPILEFVHYDNADGAIQDRDVYTVAAALIHGPWNVAAGYNAVRTNPPGGPDADLDQFQVSAGYSFDFGVDVDIGYKFVDDDHIGTHVVGLLLHYAFEFAVP